MTLQQRQRVLRLACPLWMAAAAAAGAVVAFPTATSAPAAIVSEDQANGAANTLDLMRPIVKAVDPKADKWFGLGRDAVGQVQAQQNRDLERMKSAALPLALADELAARAAPDLAHRLPELDDVKASDHQMVLEIGRVLNKSGDQHARFVALSASIRTALANSEALTDSFVLVDRTSDSAKQDKAAAKETVGGDTSGFDDPLQRKASTTKETVYHPKDVYVLSSEFTVFDDDGGKRRTLTFELRTTVSHPQSGQVKLERAFKKVYRWSMEKKSFIPEA